MSFYLAISLLFMSINTGNELPTKGIEIYLKSDGVHTDFVFPVKTKEMNWQALFPPTDTKSKDSTKNYISIGWGDQGFFINTPEWSDLTFKTAFNACFYLGKSAVHVNYLNELDFRYKHVKLTISEQQYRQLRNYVTKTVTKNSKTSSCIKNKGYWETDAFYEANGSYGLFNTCNSWINSGLKSADLPACFWTPLNAGIFHKYILLDK